jgi:ABC-type lipoprotein export system ATPase subunit
MAMIFQSYALWPHMTVAQNVAYGLRFKQGVPRADRERKVTEILRVVQLAGYEHRYPGELSGGQQQRVAVARALVTDPALILADEPTGNLDQASGHEVLELLRELNRAGSTIVLITHDTEVAASAGRQVHIRDGRLSA